MKVLFIGGTGVISEAVSKLAITRNIELYMLNRGTKQEFIPPGTKLIQADIRNLEATKKALADHQFDVVVDWIAYEPQHIENDFQLFNGRTKQFIFISSASAYQKPATHYLITESTPLANPYWQYSRDKIACEELLLKYYRESGFPITIVRPSLTYGLTMIPAALNSWQYPWTIIERMRQGKPVIIHGDGTSLWTITHNTDFAKAFVGLMGNFSAIGHAFHITSDEALTWDQIYQYIAEAAGIEAKFIHISSDFICSVVPELKGSLLGDKSHSAIFDNTKIKRFVPDYVATVRFSDGIRETINWFEAHPEYCKVDDEWNQMLDLILAKYNHQ
ncbi:MAG TPA: SDR family oxidoreductase [Bacillota bacterium]|nr:SDR family oxidoreductase [Bacillota bacterium]HOL10759.1 SDR family oxidoreductase [Bacillota bacterium]HPO98470.1 SDR family oxidoreductase [Bacillota bacterium]